MIIPPVLTQGADDWAAAGITTSELLIQQIVGTGAATSATYTVPANKKLVLLGVSNGSFKSPSGNCEFRIGGQKIFSNSTVGAAVHVVSQTWPFTTSSNAGAVTGMVEPGWGRTAPVLTSIPGASGFAFVQHPFWMVLKAGTVIDYYNGDSANASIFTIFGFLVDE